MNNKQFTGSESADNPVKFMEDEHEDDDDYDEETVAKVDYYAILGVERTATLQEIKTAFRKLSRESHPDIQVCEFVRFI
jgi:DnaJ-domain-containing protein 1